MTETPVPPPAPAPATSRLSSIANKVGLGAAATGILAALGFIARESQHDFLGVQHEHFDDLKGLGKVCSVEAVFFIYNSLVIALRYTAQNFIGTIVTIAAAIGLFLLLRRRPELPRKAFAAWYALPLLLVLSVGKLLYFDVPTLYFNNVLLKDVVIHKPGGPPVFPIPSFAFAWRGETIWRDVICSRIGNAADVPCFGNAAFHRRRMDGRYVFDSGATVLLLAFAIGLALHLRRKRAVSPRGADIALSIVVAVIVLANIAIVPSTYSRTVRETMMPYTCDTSGSDAQCTFTFCVGDKECYAYSAAMTRFDPVDKEPKDPPNDALTAHLYEILQLTPPQPPANVHTWFMR